MKPVDLRRGPGHRLPVAIGAVAVAAYPFAVAAGLERAGARGVAAPMLAVVLLAALLSSSRRSMLLPLLVRRFGLFAVVTLAAVVTDHPAALTLLPSLSSLWLLWIFGSTLREGPSLVAQFARSMHDGFPDFLLPYCRRVTVMWCVFFAANAVVSAYMAVAASPRAWALYTGVVSYAAIGLLATAEYVFHKSRFRFYEDGWADSLWRRACPPERTALGRRTLEWQLARRRQHP